MATRDDRASVRELDYAVDKLSHQSRAVAAARDALDRGEVAKSVDQLTAALEGTLSGLGNLAIALRSRLDDVEGFKTDFSDRVGELEEEVFKVKP